jgi:hypothetical protein
MKYFFPFLYLASGFIAPAHGQVLLDATASTAIQPSLQSGSNGNALQLLNDAKALTNPKLQQTLQPGQTPTNLLAIPASQKPTISNAAIGADQVLFSVNGKGIGLCSSGLPCLYQLRKAMGLP